MISSKSLGAFHSTKIFEISGLKSNGTGIVPGNFFENLGIRFALVLVSGNLKIPEFSVPSAISLGFSLLAVLKLHVTNKMAVWDKLPGGGGYSQNNWVGVCGPLPKTLTLFMTKICDFPYPIYDLTKNLIPYL